MEMNKNKRSVYKKTIDKNDAEKSYRMVNGMIRTIDQSQDFILDSKQSYNIEKKSTRPLPSTTNIKQVVVDKVKVTEASQLKVLTDEEKAIAIWGYKQYEEQFSAKKAIDEPIEKNFEEMKKPQNGESSDYYIEETKKIEGEKLTYIKKDLRPKNRFFFKARDHEKFYDVGKSYYEDYKQGNKFFLFTNLNSATPQQKTILGVASFIQYFENAKVLILTSRINQNYFREILRGVDGEDLSISPNMNGECTFFFHEGMTFTDALSLEKLKIDSGLDLEQVIEHLTQYFDCVICDLPAVIAQSEKRDLYFPLYKKAASVSFVVGENKSSFKDVDKLKEYFEAYNVKIKGILMAKEVES
ncbi:MAG: hypothetical protein ACOYL6_00050 [Bacteriovoracaceae bacterium]